MKISRILAAGLVLLMFRSQCSRQPTEVPKITTEDIIGMKKIDNNEKWKFDGVISLFSYLHFVVAEKRVKLFVKSDTGI